MWQLKLHRVVPGHSPAVLEAPDLFQAQFRTAEGRNAGSGHCGGGTWKRRLNRGRNCSNTVLACPDACSPRPAGVQLPAGPERFLPFALPVPLAWGDRAKII